MMLTPAGKLIHSHQQTRLNQMTCFCRYSEGQVEARIAAILTSEGFSSSTEEAVGSAVGLVLDRTPFYAEQGGQVADIGRISSASGIEYFEVQDTQVGHKSHASASA